MREAVWSGGFDKSIEVKLILAAFERLLNGNRKARLKDVLYEYGTKYYAPYAGNLFLLGLLSDIVV
jgi:hypothetical protein